MATTTISGLTEVIQGNLTDAAVVPVDDANADTRKATLAELRTQMGNGPQVFTGLVRLGGVATLNVGVNQNDYNPGAVAVVRLDPTADFDLTGIVPQADGQFLLLVNVSTTFEVTLPHLSASSAQGNRIIGVNGLATFISQREGATLWYDPTSTAWRVISLGP